eukprot:CAMPEP_0113723284 /NCGR_PEP_ID=MMETSP0038_2-20120614/38318_1 /TAXON_ID=2898 /ORGANISM="Cryptomonas paramecium" /LENGTH=188 /DNA_ID=CAMNT_0000652817 /DNA_START=462 /DNA_END=1024 /DNA_ORIENTATION=+ /assembly_acc=CAM_ASM_000170
MEGTAKAEICFENAESNPLERFKSLVNMDAVGHNNVFTWEQCSSKVQPKSWFGSGNKEARMLLHNMAGVLRGGTDIAIMGPSGAGKSTLLNLLTLVPSSAKTFGDVRLNGQPLTDAIFKQYCAYVPQVDHLWPFLTCREVIQYSADFHMNAPFEDRKQRVDEMLQVLGLDECADTLCGSAFVQGLSGG